MLKKITLNLFFILGISHLAWAADNNPSTNVPSSANPTQNKAIEFARQAGSIAGVAQACGQNTADFTQRIAEAVNKLTNNPGDKAAAMLIYQQVVREAQMTEQKMQTIPCTKALQDFRNLPIMQADYKEKVIAQLNASES